MSKSEHSMVGTGIHILKDGRISNQAEIVKDFGDGTYLIQYYEWVCGSPTNQKIVSRAFLAAEDVKLYPSMEAASEAYARSDGRRG